MVIDARFDKIYGNLSENALRDLTHIFNEWYLVPREMRMTSSERQYLKDKGIILYMPPIKNVRGHWQLTSTGRSFMYYLSRAGFITKARGSEKLKFTSKKQITPQRRTKLLSQSYKLAVEDTEQSHVSGILSELDDIDQELMDTQDIPYEEIDTIKDKSRLRELQDTYEEIDDKYDEQTY